MNNHSIEDDASAEALEQDLLHVATEEAEEFEQLLARLDAPVDGTAVREALWRLLNQGRLEATLDWRFRIPRRNGATMEGDAEGRQTNRPRNLAAVGGA